MEIQKIIQNNDYELYKMLMKEKRKIKIEKKSNCNLENKKYEN